MLAAEGRARLGGAQARYDRQAGRQRAELAAPIRGAVAASTSTATSPLASAASTLTKPATRLAGAPRQAEKLDATPRQQRLDAIRKPGLDRDRRLRRPREKPLGHGLRHYIAARRQPQTPARQACRRYRARSGRRIDDEAQQLGLSAASRR